jgi:ABC-type sugar transport system ATPase subunit
VAVDSVDFDVRRGEIHALVGENGAGKSTLIKILGGVYLADSGKILMDGREVSFASTHDSQLSRISVIFQEFNLVPDLSVAENIFIGREPKTAAGTWSISAPQRPARGILDTLEMPLDVKSYVSDLSWRRADGGNRQGALLRIASDNHGMSPPPPSRKRRFARSSRS